MKHGVSVSTVIKKVQILKKDGKGDRNNLIICCTIENQKTADEGLPIYLGLPLRHKQIIIQPIPEGINIASHLKDIKGQYLENETNFKSRQSATNFVKDGVKYALKRKDLPLQAKKANINIEQF